MSQYCCVTIDTLDYTIHFFFLYFSLATFVPTINIRRIWHVIDLIQSSAMTGMKVRP